MTELLHELVERAGDTQGQRDAISHKDISLPYSELADLVSRVAEGLVSCGLEKHDRVGVYLPKQPETVAAFFGTSKAGGVFVPLNPLLKALQIAHILRDCNVRILITSAGRLEVLSKILGTCHDLHTVVLVDESSAGGQHGGALRKLSWAELLDTEPATKLHRVIDSDIAAIFYTSGSTGRPKGVMLSHKNMAAGARSVASYLQNRPSDRILAVLPLSFDYGFSQLSTSFGSGACAVLMDYLLPRDVIKTVGRQGITGLAGVPPLWVQLAQLEWPPEAAQRLRYITNSGGAMPRTTLAALRQRLPDTDVFLMYGLTEAFRSTFLPPEQVDKRPDSIGKAIPNAEILVVRDDGALCGPGEPGELVHRGSLVAMGYWNDKEKTAEHFRPAPGRLNGLVLPEIAVWSGDTVRLDEEGYLYFVGRRDDMIKTSGYRVSPTEVEEVVYATGLVGEAAAIGISHPTTGQAIVVVATAAGDGEQDEAILLHCRQQLPAFMVPAAVVWRSTLPRSPNGKLDRRQLAFELQDIFQENSK